jgi:mercuric ion binding protein
MSAVLLVAPAGTQAATIEMTVNGLVCGFCAQGIEKTFRKNPVVDEVIVSLENRLVAIVTKSGQDIPDADLTTALRNAGYGVKVIQRTERSAREIRDSLQKKP